MANGATSASWVHVPCASRKAQCGKAREAWSEVARGGEASATCLKSKKTSLILGCGSRRFFLGLDKISKPSVFQVGLFFGVFHILLYSGKGIFFRRTSKNY
jgi:hypothetical protein